MDGHVANVYLIIRPSKNPKLILIFNETDKNLIRVLKDFNAGRYNLHPLQFYEEQWVRIIPS